MYPFEPTASTDRPRRALLVVAALATLSTACPRGADQPTTPVPRAAAGPPLSTPKILSRSETRPLSSATILGDTVYAGTADGLLTFNMETGEAGEITHMVGLPDAYRFPDRRQPIGQVHGVAGSPRTGLWVATPSLLLRLRDGKWDRFEYHPLLSMPVTVLLAEGDNVWVGAARNLAIYHGWWYGFLRGSRITYLLEERVMGGVWVGTDGDGIHRWVGGKFNRHGAEQGQRIEVVRSITYNASWGVIAVGRGQGKEWLAFFDGKHWTSYEVMPRTPVRWVKQVGDRTLLSFGGRILRLRLAPPVIEGAGRKAKPLPQGPARLLGKLAPDAPAGYLLPHLYTEPAGRWLPPQPVQVAAVERRVLFATKHLGVALAEGDKTRWFRTNDLLGDNGALRMACTDFGRCYMPGAGGGAYRVTGTEFVPVDIAGKASDRVQGFFGDTLGELYALHSPAGRSALVVSRLDGKRFVRVSEHAVAVPAGSRPEVRFIRLDAARRPWVGLWHVDSKGDRQPWGVVRLPPLVDLARMQTPDVEVPAWAAGDDEQEQQQDEPELELPGWAADEADKQKPAPEPAPAPAPAPPAPAPVAIYRNTLLPGEQRPAGSLALPDDIRGVWFRGPETWFATDLGVLRHLGDDVVTFTENEGLASELTYGGIAEGAGVMVGTFAGVGRYDGKEWRFDLAPQLNNASRVLINAAPWLLVGTTHGVVQHARGAHRYLDARVGLVSDDVTDLYLDAKKRLWVKAAGGLSVISGF